MSTIITAQSIKYIHEVESLDSWQRRVLGWEGNLLWEDSTIKGYWAIKRGFLAAVFKGDRVFLYLLVSPEDQRTLKLFKPDKPMSRSKVDFWVTWLIVNESRPYPKRYEPDCLRRCRRILLQHPEAIMPLLTPREGGFSSKLWSYLAKDLLNAF